MHQGADLLGSFFAGEGGWLGLDREARLVVTAPSGLLPGAFNPVHAGHWALAATAERLLRHPVAFELSLVNVDKPALTIEDVRRRLTQFRGRASVYLSRAATFVHKASLFPGTVFVVGADTAARVVMPRYYGLGPSAMAQALSAISSLGCRFLVAGRVDRAGHYIGLDDLPVPPEFAALFNGIARDEFQLDVSSTDLRDKGIGVAEVQGAGRGRG